MTISRVVQEYNCAGTCLEAKRLVAFLFWPGGRVHLYCSLFSIFHLSLFICHFLTFVGDESLVNDKQME